MKKRENILLCLRTDREKVLRDEELFEIKKSIEGTFKSSLIDYTDTVLKYDIYPNERRKKVHDKLEQFGNYKLVITDRLHGMIFAAITGTPCIAINNSNKKVEKVYQWIKDTEYVYCLSDVNRIDDIIKRISFNDNANFDFISVNKKFEVLIKELFIERKK